MQCLNLRHFDIGKFIVVFKYMIDLRKAHGEDVPSGVFLPRVGWKQEWRSEINCKDKLDILATAENTATITRLKI